jgi:hypothetical protein
MSQALSVSESSFTWLAAHTNSPTDSADDPKTSFENRFLTTDNSKPGGMRRFYEIKDKSISNFLSFLSVGRDREWLRGACNWRSGTLTGHTGRANSLRGDAQSICVNCSSTIHWILTNRVLQTSNFFGTFHVFLKRIANALTKCVGCVTVKNTSRSVSASKNEMVNRIENNARNYSAVRGQRR